MAYKRLSVRVCLHEMQSKQRRAATFENYCFSTHVSNIACVASVYVRFARKELWGDKWRSISFFGSPPIFRAGKITVIPLLSLSLLPNPTETLPTQANAGNTVKLKLMFNPFGPSMPTLKIDFISCCLRLVLLPVYHCFKPQTMMSSGEWEAELKCSATGNPRDLF